MAKPPQRSLRILLVENHRDSREYLALYLEGFGHQVTAATTMNEALAAATAREYDVVLSDIGLSDGNGWQLLEKARFIKPVFAIAMSGFGMNTDREKSRQAGYRHHLLKPLQVEKLDAILLQAAEESNAE